MRAFSAIRCLAGLWPCLTYGFVNPIRTGSDPHMVYENGMYYLTSTTWTDVRITAASTIEGLKTAEPRVIWSDTTNPARACNFWAPEMHKLGDRWYTYFTASVCNSDWGIVLPSLRVFVLEGGEESPLSANYTLLDSIVPPNYDGGMLDATVFEIDNTKYFLFSAVKGPISPDGASLWIAELLSPTECGNATMIAAPEYEWEKEDSAVLEGPYGSPDGTQDWQVFHANLNPGDGCGTTRKVFIQPVSWTNNTVDLGDPLPVGTEINPPSGE
ncbi:hypothetical protein JMJ77_0009901 [Colletotrichum scovillei]|uniref:Glycosyl hydrolase family 43 n=1 Tax=Colletotrichum scovillei TaxID=1209932 RepID=A0A9P7UAE3_9PEZI|nr:hypothetical protein JMJ78_0000021 [Colletotrichum scovillei]KAG7040347.1 hypothetical protein JMJ77_0009901 [Colletotrichum scovillei]